MIDPSKYLNQLNNLGINFFTGVPDSLLKDFCGIVSDNLNADAHIIASNEGAAIALAIGNYLGTGNVPLVYMQNSGLGNTVNPLMSLASPEIYGIPMLLLIGWRGEPGVIDEPQHIHQGRSMLDILKSMDIPTVILSKKFEIASEQTTEATNKAKDICGPVAIIVRKGLFKKYNYLNPANNFQITREEAIIEVVSLIGSDSLIVCTTGMASRELFEYRAKTSTGHHMDFLTVGGMGHANQIALGLALSQPTKKIYCIDGDGALLMHMGSLAITGTSKASNLIHIVLNNGVHASVGGQQTVGLKIDLCELAKASGYKSCSSVTTLKEIHNSIVNAQNVDGPSFIEIKVSLFNRNNLGRPTTSPRENKEALMNFLNVS